MYDEKREAPAREATRVEAETEKPTCRAAISNSYDTTVTGGRQAGFVEALLHRGGAHAIPTAQLVALTGYRSARELQKAIEIERGGGALILSKGGSSGGYFLPGEGATGYQEIAAYERTLRRRALSTLKTLKAARRALKEIDGQERMEEAE